MADQHRRQHGAQRHRRNINARQHVAKRAHHNAKHQQQQDNRHLPHVVQQVRPKQIQRDDQNHHRQHHRDPAAPVGGIIQRVVVQQPQRPQHLKLRSRNPVAFPNNVLSLNVNNGINGVHGALLGLFRGFLVNGHVRLDAGPKHRGQNVLRQRDIHLISDDLKNGLNRLGNLSFPNGGVHRVVHRRGHQVHHVVKHGGFRPQHRHNLVPVQVQVVQQPHGIGNFLFGEGIQPGAGFAPQRQPVLLYGPKLVKSVVQRQHHFFLHALLKPVRRLHRRGRRALLVLRGHLVNNVLRRVDRVVGNGSDRKRVFLRHAHQEEDDQNQRKRADFHQDTLETGRSQPSHEGLAFGTLDFNGFRFSHARSFPSRSVPFFSFAA